MYEGLISDATGAALAMLALSVAPEHCIVEVGSYRGASACFLAEGSRAGKGAHVYAVDAWDLPGNNAGWLKYTDPSNRLAFHARVDDGDFEDLITPIQGFSIDVARTWTGPPIGLLFIDAGHEYENVKADFDAWQPHLAPGALVAFDDYGTTKNPGVKRFVDSLGRKIRLPVPTLAVIQC